MSLPSAVRTRELSGITPSGPLTLGNHLGALRRFRAHQDNGFYFVANLHALTTEHDPRRLRQLTLSTAALFLASGLDPQRATVFLQSDVPAHLELSYLLESTAYVGELGRIAGNGQPVEVHHAVEAVPVALVGDPPAHRSQQIAEMGFTGGLDARQHTEVFHGPMVDVRVRASPAFRITECRTR